MDVADLSKLLEGKFMVNNPEQDTVDFVRSIRSRAYSNKYPAWPVSNLHLLLQ